MTPPGLSWLIGGSLTEVLTGIIFLFVKHPYDVGDRVIIECVKISWFCLLYLIPLFFSSIPYTVREILLVACHNNEYR